MKQQRMSKAQELCWVDMLIADLYDIIAELEIGQKRKRFLDHLNNAQQFRKQVVIDLPIYEKRIHNELYQEADDDDT